MKPTQQTISIQPILLTSILTLLLNLPIFAKEPSYEEHQIATIDEASGIDYCSDSDTLIVANDEGSFYEITPKGEILSRHKLGLFDLEGVVCEKEKLTFAVEGGALLEVNRKSQQSLLLPVRGQKDKINKDSGIEGITKIGDEYYLSIQAKKKKNGKILVTIKEPTQAHVKREIPIKIVDASGMIYHNGLLYIISDTKDTLYLYNLQQKQIIQKYPLPKFDQEGIAFDNAGNLYLTDDKGAVLRYNATELLPPL